MLARLVPSGFPAGSQALDSAPTMKTENSPRTRVCRGVRNVSCLLLLLAVAPWFTTGARAAVLEPDAIRFRYLGVLNLVAEGQGEAALQELAEIERAAVDPEHPTRSLEILWRAKLGVIRDLLGSQQWGAVVPILSLHHDAYRYYRELGEPLLARHSVDMTAELARFTAAKSPDPGAPQMAGRYLSSLGGHLQDGWSLSSSARLFADALELDPSNEAAHLGLASLFEKRGEYENAEEHLQRAWARRPDAPEVALRLALCRLRAGELARAEADLRKLADEDQVDWVAVLAYQELAKLEVAKGHPEAAEVLLMAARERHPYNQRLTVLVAWVRDLQGLSALALTELDQVEEESAQESPRYRYTVWPHGFLDEIRGNLSVSRDQQLVVLAGALQSAAPEAGP